MNAQWMNPICRRLSESEKKPYMEKARVLHGVEEVKDKDEVIKEDSFEWKEDDDEKDEGKAVIKSRRQLLLSLNLT